MPSRSRSSSPQPRIERQQVPEDVFLAVLHEVNAVVTRLGVPHGFIGGLASTVYGRSRGTDDIDVFVRPADAERVLDELALAGYATEETYPDWLFKAFKDGVLVDVIFKSSGGVYLDEEMIERTVEAEYRGTPVRMVAPEDLVVMKALAFDEPTPRYWFDALAILAAGDLDWPYLLERARHGPRRILSLLIHAQSNDLLVPEQAIEYLYDSIYRQPPVELPPRLRQVQ